MPTTQKALSIMAGPKHAFLIMRRLRADALVKSLPKARTLDRNMGQDHLKTICTKFYALMLIVIFDTTCWLCARFCALMFIVHVVHHAD